MRKTMAAAFYKRCKVVQVPLWADTPITIVVLARERS